MFGNESNPFTWGKAHLQSPPIRAVVTVPSPRNCQRSALLWECLHSNFEGQSLDLVKAESHQLFNPTPASICRRMAAWTPAPAIHEVPPPLSLPRVTFSLLTALNQERFPGASYEKVKTMCPPRDKSWRPAGF